MVLLPQPSIEEKINDLIEQGTIKSYPRSYIGYSELGGPCERRIWYNFRWCKLNETIPRMVRLFSHGDWEEERIIADLEKIGIEVYGKQKVINGIAGHIFGHIDGLGENVPGFVYENEIFLLEFKTANQKNFDKFKKNGVRQTKINYFHQVNCYLGKLKLYKCLFIITNKNTEERYIEIIEFDDLEFEKMQSRGFRILSTDIPPDKIGNSIWHECRYCNFHEICHKKGKILKSCRSCKYGTIEDEGKWICGLNNKILSIQDQKDACDKYQLLESLNEQSKL